MDSEKPLETEQPQEKPKVTAVIVQCSKGGERVSLRGEGGKFVKKPKTLVPTRDVTAQLRKYLTEPFTDTESRRKVKNRGAAIYESLMTIIKAGEDDPKFAVASVQAARLVFERAFGDIDPSEVSQDLLKTAGIKTVFVSVPVGVPVVGELPERERKRLPSFAGERPETREDIPFAEVVGMTVEPRK